MPVIVISCPQCGYTREVPEELLPGTRVTVACPQCKQSFVFDRIQTSAAPPLQAESAVSGTAVPGAKPQTGAGLIGTGELFSRAWEFYKARFGTLLAVYLLAMVITFVPVAAAGIVAAIVLPSMAILKSGDSLSAVLAVPLALAGLAAAGGMMYCMCWGFASFICALSGSSPGVSESFSRGRRFAFSLLWVVCIQCLILFAGFLLLIIPGIIFCVWYLFSNFTCVCENERGMAALRRSRQYVRGRWFAVFGRVALVVLAVTLLGAIPFVGGVISLLLSPFTMIYLYVLYENLKEITD